MFVYGRVCMYLRIEKAAENLVFVPLLVIRCVNVCEETACLFVCERVLCCM